MGGRHVGPFVLHKRDEPSSDAKHRWGTVSTDVLEILPAEPVSFKKRVHYSFHIYCSCCGWQGIAEQELFLHLSLFLVAGEGDQVAFQSDVGRLVQLNASLERALLDFGANLLAHISSHIVNPSANRIIR